MDSTRKDLEKPALVEGSSTKSSDCEVRHSCNLEPMDQVAQKKLLWKCDLHVLPMISILYMLAFIDRINIGNARIQGLEKDLNMKGNDYNIALLVFFVPYILFEVPSNIIIRKLAPSTWLSFLMVCWGKTYLITFHEAMSLLKPRLRHHHHLYGAYSKFCWSPSL